jgi:hypothetical protein
MSDDYRRSAFIQEELSDLQKLIRENEFLISRYPDKFSLTFKYQKLRDKEEQLLFELRNSLMRHQIDAFDYVLDGDVVDNHKVSLSFFGNLMSILQDVTFSISQSLTEKTILNGVISADVQNASRLDLVAVASGSFRVILSSHEPQLNESSAKIALRYFNDLIECGDNKAAIKEFTSNFERKVLVDYKKFLRLLYKNNADIIMYDTNASEEYDTYASEDLRPQQITHEFAKKIYDSIIEVETVPDISVEYRGVLKGISLIKNTFEFVVDDSHEKIDGKFEESLSNEVIEHLNIPTIIKFNVTTTYRDITNEEKKDWFLLEFKM